MPYRQLPTTRQQSPSREQKGIAINSSSTRLISQLRNQYKVNRFKSRNSASTPLQVDAAHNRAKSTTVLPHDR
ncbi:hypothetical protein EVAR_85253_1 [Eumeta japonica]|uniref:Uncharacterized protein n=1 Tax=Eumeta variegata TaxID=151549 RepID=A0A4C1W0R3_EUMVA|nr:hypothetical protein EVAR_85253_1 [Eumeta japonica]